MAGCGVLPKEINRRGEPMGRTSLLQEELKAQGTMYDKVLGHGVYVYAI